jgi:YfiH family protein
MHEIIKPDIFGEDLTAFFTTKSVGIDKNIIAKLLAINENKIFFPEQKHTDIVHILDSNLVSVVADAVITNKKGIMLGVKVADCVPILVYEKKNRILGVIHAGWRGTVKKLTSKTIKIMKESFSSNPLDIFIALGPSIKICCYDVGEDVIKLLPNTINTHLQYISKKDNKYFIDLSTININQIMDESVPYENIWNSSDCTCCMPNKYFSYRYMKTYAGSQGGFIGIL